LTHIATKFGVERFGVSTSESGHLPDSERIKIGGNRRPDSRDPRKLGDDGSGRQPPSCFPCAGGFGGRRCDATFSVRHTRSVAPAVYAAGELFEEKNTGGTDRRRHGCARAPGVVYF
jgi:hypothetical protein